MPLSSDRHIIDDKFKIELRNHKTQPAGRLWSRIYGELSNTETKKSVSTRLFLMILFLLVGSGGVMLKSYLSNRSDDKQTAVIENVQLETGVETLITDNVKLRDNTSSPLMNPQVEQENKLDDAITQIITRNIKAEAPMKMEPKDNREIIWVENTKVPMSWGDGAIFIDQLNISPYKIQFALPAVDKTRIFKNHLPLPKITMNPRYYIADASGFYYGFGTTFNNTWILNKEAIKNKNLKYKPTFGFSLMVQGGYNFNNKLGMEMAWVLNSTEGQRYDFISSNNRTTSLEYSQKHISLEYMHVPILMRYKVQGYSSIVQAPIFVNYSLGLQYGRMISYSVDETKEKVSENLFFRKNEYALVAGFDYDFMTRKSTFLTIGLRTSVGSNLFIKDAPEDLEFESPHNVLIGIHGAINFSIPKVHSQPQK